jgi:hypothetical protein
MPKVILTYEDQVKAEQERRDRYFLSVIAGNEKIYHVNKNKVCQKMGISIQQLNNLLRNPRRIRREQQTIIFVCYRFSNEQILECV